MHLSRKVYSVKAASHVTKQFSEEILAPKTTVYTVPKKDFVVATTFGSILFLK